VAALAGVPSEVIDFARKQLQQLENSSKTANTRENPETHQMNLFTPQSEDHAAIKQLRDIDPDEMSPRQALDALYQLRKLVDQ
jgi:DNA mismatch repair protein MutS